MPLDSSRKSPSALVRAKLDHPVIDGDGHTLEYDPIFFEYLAQVAGPGTVKRYRAMRANGGPYYAATEAERLDKRIPRAAYWGSPARNTLDRATAMMPNLLRARMDEFGIDFSVLHTSMLHINRHADEEIRRAGCRALNIMRADMFRSHGDRLTPAAAIPMHTPDEAIEELDFAVKELGAKAIMTAGIVRRPIPIVAREAPEFARYTFWVDNLALGSKYDYDPFWAKCVEYKVSPMSHTTGIWGSRADTRNFVHNHLGHFASSGEAACRGLFLGGVTRRFPTLRFGFMEGGVNWACSLYNDLFEHWEKRSYDALMENLNPATIDKSRLADLAAEFGGEHFARHVADFTNPDFPGLPKEERQNIDDFAACAIKSGQDIHDLFVPSFFFGCESDDRMLFSAFNAKVNRFGARLGATFSSDIGHWDVNDMRGVLAEAYEAVEDGRLTEKDFRDFTYTNLLKLLVDPNPDFFKGTVIEHEVEKYNKDRRATV